MTFRRALPVYAAVYAAARDVVHAHRGDTRRDIDSPEDYQRLVVELEAAP